MSVTAQSKVWFITGTSTGLGRSLTEYVLSRGHIVVATLRKLEDLKDLKAKYSDEQLLILKVDVSNLQDITDAFERVGEVFGRLDVVVNNAGYGLIGEIEGTPEDVARAMFDVNFWGATNVSRAAVKFFRDVNKPGVGGRLINVSSMGGIHPLATTGFYCAAKQALEGFTQALAQELDPDWNVKVSLIEPGGFNTDAVSRSAVILPLHPAYDKAGLPATLFRSYLDRGGYSAGDPNKAVAKWVELSELPDPPLRLILGKDAIQAARRQIDELTQDLNAREYWSNNLLVDN